jgi:hypothetical protein
MPELLTDNVTIWREQIMNNVTSSPFPNADPARERRYGQAETSTPAREFASMLAASSVGLAPRRTIQPPVSFVRQTPRAPGPPDPQVCLAREEGARSLHPARPLPLGPADSLISICQSTRSRAGFLLPLREKVAVEGGRMRGRTGLSALFSTRPIPAAGATPHPSASLTPSPTGGEGNPVFCPDREVTDQPG